MRVKNDYSEEHPNLRGSRLWKQGDLLGAEESFLASIERNSESDTGYGILTGFYLEQGEFRKARLTLKKWREETPLRFKASYHIMWARLLSLEAIHEVIAERSEHKKQSALFHLKAAMDAGFDNDDIILKDPKLEYVRDTPEFWQLVREVNNDYKVLNNRRLQPLFTSRRFSKRMSLKSMSHSGRAPKGDFYVRNSERKWEHRFRISDRRRHSRYASFYGFSEFGL